MKYSEISPSSVIGFGVHTDMYGNEVENQWIKLTNDGQMMLCQRVIYGAVDHRRRSGTNVQRTHGVNLNSQTDLFKWLNSSGTVEYPDNASHGYAGNMYPGFLDFFTPSERKAMQQFVVKTIVPSGYQKEHGKIEQSLAWAALPSAGQIDEMTDGRYIGEAPFVGFDIFQAIPRGNGVSRIATRSPIGKSLWLCSTYSTIHYTALDRSESIFPVISIKPDTEFDLNRTTGIYTIRDAGDDSIIDGLMSILGLSK